MGPDLSADSSSSRVPRLLIVENNLAYAEPLMNTMGDRRLNVTYDVCTTARGAVRKLTRSPYQLIISAAELAEQHDALLLKRSHALETFVPVVVTTSTTEHHSARRALINGVFDLITHPLNHERTVRTIRLALWQNKFQNLFARKETALATHLVHVRKYPGKREELDATFARALSAVERTMASLEQTFQRIEESHICFSDFATKVAYYTKQRALERLDNLYGQTPTIILLIDSQKEDRACWAQRLRVSLPDCIVLEADTGEAGLALYRSQRVDCVVMELSLSDMSGFEVLMKLVQRPKRSDCAVIVLTKLMLASMGELAISNGAQAYLVKSRTSGDEVGLAIRKAVETVGAPEKKGSSILLFRPGKTECSSQ